MEPAGLPSEVEDASTERGFFAVQTRVAEFTDDELDAEYRSLELAYRELNARMAATLEVIDRRDTYRGAGHRSLAGYQRATCQISHVELRRRSRLRALCADQPAIGDAILAGRVAVDHALEIDRIRTNPRIAHVLGDVVDTLLAHAQRLSFRDFRRLIDQFILLADQDGSFKELEHNIEHRSAIVDDLDSVLNVAASGGDPITATRLTLIFRQFCEREFALDVEAREAEHGADAEAHPLPRNAAQRRFDALVKIFDTAAGAESVGVPAAPIVNIVIDEHSLHSAFVDEGLLAPLGDDESALEFLVEEFNAEPESMCTRRCHTETGAVVHPRTALQAALLGHIRRMVVDSQSVTIDLGTKQRLFTGHARTAAQLLRSHCSHPGCEVPTDQAQIDHLREFHEGGATNQRNAGIRCGPHNIFKHLHQLRERKDRFGRVYTLLSDGTIMLPVGVDPPPELALAA